MKIYSKTRLFVFTLVLFSSALSACTTIHRHCRAETDKEAIDATLTYLETGNMPEKKGCGA